MGQPIDIDLEKLAQLYPHHNHPELAKMFGCSKNTIKNRLKMIGAIKPGKPKKKKHDHKKFSPVVREMLMENCL
jgi:transcriptional antiterminator